MIIGEIYKLNTGEDIELNVEYEYYVCISEKKEYWILHNFKSYCRNNSINYNSIDDIDELFQNKEILNNDKFKQINSLESVYYKNKIVEQTKINKRKFVKI